MLRSQRTVVSCVDCICCDHKKICYTVDFSIDKSKPPVRQYNYRKQHITVKKQEATIMKKFEEMSKSEMETEIAFTKDFVNNGGCLNQSQWDRVLKLMELVKEG